jgi:glycine/serine hydroxymethyltransferase
VSVRVCTRVDAKETVGQNRVLTAHLRRSSATTGQVGARYYGGTNVIDKVEGLCKTRALTAFGLSPDEWAVNVQP